MLWRKALTPAKEDQKKRTHYEHDIREGTCLASDLIWALWKNLSRQRTSCIPIVIIIVYHLFNLTKDPLSLVVVCSPLFYLYSSLCSSLTMLTTELVLLQRPVV